MKYSKTRYVAAGLVTALAISSALVAGFAPASESSQAAAAVGSLVAATPTVKVATQAAAPVAKTTVRTRTAVAATRTSASTTSKSTRTAVYKTAAATKTTAGSTSELAQARSILAGLIAKHPILKGVTVTMGSTPNSYQAVCYYRSGRIVVNPHHTASLSRILNHEVWHVIDWRDNGRIDWGENVPR